MTPKAALRLAGVNTFYGDVHVLRGVDLAVPRGSVLALLGRNGAGKTTTLRSIMGLTPARSGQIEVAGTRTESLPPHRISRLGVGHVPQGRWIFAGLTVEENLRVAHRRNGSSDRLQLAYDMFPTLFERRRQDGSTLSGGEQQMLAIARALMTEPEVLLLDEPTEGLSPVMVRSVGEVIERLREQGLAILLVEQVLSLALSVADDVAVLGRGEIVFRSPAAALRTDPSPLRQYLV